MFKRWVTISGCLATFVLINPMGLLAQSIWPSQPTPGSAPWQPPVRLHPPGAPSPIDGRGSAESARQPVVQIQYVEPLDPVAMVAGTHAHQVIQAPRIDDSVGSYPHTRAGHPATTNPTPKSGIDPVPHLLNHHATQPPAAAIPDASYREVWKSPFSYGYFGASGSRKWTRHFGYRDRDKEWRLR